MKFIVLAAALTDRSLSIRPCPLDFFEYSLIELDFAVMKHLVSVLFQSVPPTSLLGVKCFTSLVFHFFHP